MIAQRAKFYISAIKEKRNLADLRGAAIWNHETAKLRSIAEIETDLSGDQLNALARLLRPKLLPRCERRLLRGVHILC